MKNWLIFLVIPLGALLLFSTGFYTYWNHADPRSTCASCHEITPSVSTWEHSAHRDVPCFDCHGTALGNGIHSLKEKANMVFTHFREDVHSGEIRLSEDQVLEMQARCAGCHQSEQARWSAGGHATVYERIFLDSVHNTREQLYWDCFRCHGMYYAGNIYDLVTPVSTQGPWSLREPAKAGQPLIPCLACHQMHSANEPLRTGTGADERNPACGLYLRSDKMHLRADLLPMPDLLDEGREVRVSADPAQSLCLQCHAPGAHHAAGSSDDRTPTGVHEGLSCRSCHEVHSNSAARSCAACHPAISNCGLDVHTMNTSYLDPASPNNIHFVSCTDCHSGEMPVRAIAK
jgi:hypothetical protein